MKNHCSYKSTSFTLPFFCIFKVDKSLQNVSFTFIVIECSMEWLFHYIHEINWTRRLFSTAKQWFQFIRKIRFQNHLEHFSHFRISTKRIFCPAKSPTRILRSAIIGVCVSVCSGVENISMWTQMD